MDRVAAVLLLVSALGVGSSTAAAEFKRIRFDFEVPLGEEAPGIAVDGHRVAFASGATVRVVDARTGESEFERSAVPEGIRAPASPWVQVLGLSGDAVYARVFLFDDPDRPDPAGGEAVIGGGPEQGRLFIVRVARDAPSEVVLELPHAAMTADRLLDSSLVYAGGSRLHVHPLEGQGQPLSFGLGDELRQRPQVRAGLVLGIGYRALHIYSRGANELQHIKYLGTPLASVSEIDDGLHLADGYVLVYTGRRLLCYEPAGDLRFSLNRGSSTMAGDREIVCMLWGTTVMATGARDGRPLWRRNLPLYTYYDHDVNGFGFIDSRLLVFAEDKIVVLDAATGRVLVDMPQRRKLQRGSHHIYDVLCRVRTVPGAAVIAFERSVLCVDLTPTGEVPVEYRDRDPANATAALKSLMARKPDDWPYDRALVDIGRNLADTPEAFDAALPAFVARVNSEDRPPDPKLLMAFHWVRDPAVPAAIEKALPQASGIASYLFGPLAGHPDTELSNRILLRLARDAETNAPHLRRYAASYLRIAGAGSLPEADRAILYGDDAEKAVREIRRRLGDRDATVRRGALALLERAPDSVILRLREPMNSLSVQDERQAADALLRDAAKRVSLTGRYDEVEPPSNWQLGQVDAIKAAAKGLAPPPAPVYSSPAEKARALVKDLGSADDKVWPKARSALYKMGSLPIPFLIEALEPGNDKLRRRAAERLGGIGRGARDAVPALLTAIEGADPKLRRTAAYALGRITGEEDNASSRRRFGLPPRETARGSGVAVPALAEALRDSDRFVREAAAEALAQIGPAAKDAVPALLDALHGKEDAEFVDARRKAAWALCRIGPDANVALPALVKALGDKDRGVRLAAAGALCGMRADAAEAVPALIRSLSTESMGGGIGRGMYGSIMDIGTAAIPALIEALGDDSDQVRRFAADTLGHFGRIAKDAASALERYAREANQGDLCHPTYALGSMGADGVPALTRLLEHPDDKVRRSAAGALRSAGPEAASAAPALGRALSDPSWLLRETACITLGEQGRAAESAGPMLQSLFDDENPRVRAYAAQSFWRVTGRVDVAVAALRRSLEDEGWVEITVAERTLVEIGPGAREAVPDLIGLLGRRSHLVRELAAEALGRIGPAARAALPALVKALDDEGYRYDRDGVRVRAAVALWRITGEPERALPVLKSVVGTHVQSTSIALRALGEMGPAASEAVPVLASALGKYASHELPETLGRIGPAAREAVPAIEKALDGYARNRRVAAAEALWRITGKADKALPVLLRIAQEKLWSRYLRPVRCHAVEVIRDMGPAASDAVPVLTKLIEDEDPDVRQAAVDALRKIRKEGE